jgi:hypothetical protein
LKTEYCIGWVRLKGRCFMIKDFKTVDPPKVELGNLGLHNACSYYVPKDPKIYPVAWFARKHGNGTIHLCISDKPENCPRGYRIYEQFDTPMEKLLEYAQTIQEEHADLTDEQINYPASFIGRKRSARWEDERRRRGLIS